ncbi:MAG TPA: RNA polymerase sigma factor [Phycisphaerae bacterium]|nr:RNA polymerase sigma factor [Phycisphaerae bacterium]HRW54131.1 RNA polymerase sigma factor [Phycisphaerae bacterium]
MRDETFDDYAPALGAADAALQRLVDEYGGQLFHLAYRFCGSREEAEDLVQEVFMQAFRAWGAFRGESDEKTWLFRIAARACQRMHRKRAGEPADIGSLHDLLPFGEPLIAAIPSEQEDAVQQQIRKEAGARIEREIAALPDEFRVPILLKEIVGFGVDDIAQILDIPVATVRSRVHRARLKLRAALDEAIPRGAGVAPPPAYAEQTCLDLLDAKQDALDRGVPFDNAIICDRCRSVFASLDLTQEICRAMTGGGLPDDLRRRLRTRLREGADIESTD